MLTEPDRNKLRARQGRHRTLGFKLPPYEVRSPRNQAFSGQVGQGRIKLSPLPKDPRISAFTTAGAHFFGEGILWFLALCIIHIFSNISHINHIFSPGSRKRLKPKKKGNENFGVLLLIRRNPSHQSIQSKCPPRSLSYKITSFSVFSLVGVCDSTWFRIIFPHLVVCTSGGTNGRTIPPPAVDPRRHSSVPARASLRG